MSETTVEPPAGDRAAGLPAWRRRASDTLLGGRGSLAFPVIGAVVLLLFPVFSNDQYWLNQLSLIAVLFLVVSGVNLSFGYAGEVQFGQVFMFALGSYVTMILAVSDGFTEIIPLLIIGGIVAALAGFVVALPALRIGGWSLAMASFFLVITLPDWAQVFQSKTGGDNGLIKIASPNLFGTALGTKGLYTVTAVAALLWLLCYRNLVTSRYGVIFRILRESPVQASFARLLEDAPEGPRLHPGRAACRGRRLPIRLHLADHHAGRLRHHARDRDRRGERARRSRERLRRHPRGDDPATRSRGLGQLRAVLADRLRRLPDRRGRAVARRDRRPQPEGAVRLSRLLVHEAVGAATVTSAGSLSSHGEHVASTEFEHLTAPELLGGLSASPSRWRTSRRRSAGSRRSTA